ncbi:hypothetical protein SLS60_000511 [Paraconiothyrium brasiliense]|uniref:Major facilitator superfamily (MFS) profile domain-containing protein n=1 Tax=Paraconiothyrium brasiliense TaxID=300254 RepID=A0ABR3S6G6_9PLEO
MSTIWTGDIFGRPRQIIIGSTVIGIGAIIQTASYGVPQMMVGRIVAGMGTGMNTATAGVWQAETSKMSSRGKLVIIQMGKHEEALEVLAALEGHGATPESASVRTQYDIIKDILDREHMNTYTWWQLLSGKGPSGVLRRMILGAWMQAMNQISGINVTSYYMSYIFINALGISELLSRILAAAGSVDYLVFACLAYFVIERINALEMRTKGASLAMSTNWIMNYAVVQVTLPGIQNIGWKFWIIWAVICFSFIPITYFFYPETANRTLEDIDRFFETSPGILVHRNKLAIQLHRPVEYIEADEQIAIAQAEERNEGGEKSEFVATKEAV